MNLRSGGRADLARDALRPLARVKMPTPARAARMAGNPASAHEATRLREMPLARKVTFWGFATLVVLGVAFYLWWGLTYNVWIDNGVYAVTITLLAFGLAGMWLVLPTPLPPTNP